MKQAFAASALLTLTACGAQPVRLVAVPAEYTDCAEWPQAPDMPAWDWSSIEAARAIAWQRDMITLAYEQEGFAAHADCKADVAAVKAWSEKGE